MVLLSSCAAAPSQSKSGRSYFPFMDMGPYMDNEISRAIPDRNFESPIYYIRLPPIPYSYVPGFGYISHADAPSNTFVNLPINFVSNGKPSTVYRYAKSGTKYRRETDPSKGTNFGNFRGRYFRRTVLKNQI